MGEPVLEEMLTHSHPSWSSNIPYQLPRSTMTVQFMCLTVPIHNFSPGPLVYLLVWSPLLHTPYVTNLKMHRNNTTYQCYTKTPNIRPYVITTTKVLWIDPFRLQQEKIWYKSLPVMGTYNTILLALESMNNKNLTSACYTFIKITLALHHLMFCLV